MIRNLDVDNSDVLPNLKLDNLHVLVCSLFDTLVGDLVGSLFYTLVALNLVGILVGILADNLDPLLALNLVGILVGILAGDLDTLVAVNLGWTNVSD